MTGIVIAGPERQEIFREVFKDMRVEWRTMPGTGSSDFVIDLEYHSGRRKALEVYETPLILINSVPAPLPAGERFVRINAWNTFLQRPLAEVVARPLQVDAVSAWCTSLGKEPVFLPDVPGMPTARIVAMIINEAYFTWGEGVSTPEEIDTAMRLGTNYPYGPFTWARLIGLQAVYELLVTLSQTDPRYEIAPLLREEALSHAPVA